MTLPLRANLRIELVLNHEAAGVYGHSERLFLTKRAGESMHHVAMKLLAYLFCWRPDLRIEESIGQHYLPDLVATNPAGRPELWIDCGRTAPNKLERVLRSNPHTTVVIMKRTPGELYRYATMMRGRGLPEHNLRWLSVPDGALDRLVEQLGVRHHAVATVTGPAPDLFLELDGTLHELRAVGA